MRWISGVVLLVLGVGSGGCTLNDLVATVHPRDAGAVKTEDAGPEDAGPEDAGLDGGTPTALDEYCTRPGPVWIVDPGWGDGGETCVGHLVSRVFEHALCSLNGIDSSAPFTTQTVGGADAGGASVWTAAAFRANDRVTLGGSLQVESQGVTTTRVLSVSGDLLVRGTLGFNSATRVGSVWVGGDAKVAGDVFLDSLTVGGTLFLPDAGLLDVDGGLSVSQVQRGPVGTFTPVCPTSSLEDIASLVSLHRTENHDRFIQLEPAALDGFTEDPRLLTLPCGRFYLSQIQGGTKTLQLHVTGRTTLFVGGDVSVGSLEVQVDPDAQLDLFIAGSLTTAQRLVLDSSGTPSHLRVYLAQAEVLNVPADHSLSAHLYVPNALLRSDSPLNLSGSLFVNQLSCAGLSLSFDPDILQVESTCSPGG